MPSTRRMLGGGQAVNRYGSPRFQPDRRTLGTLKGMLGKKEQGPKPLPEPRQAQDRSDRGPTRWTIERTSGKWTENSKESSIESLTRHHEAHGFPRICLRSTLQ